MPAADITTLTPFSKPVGNPMAGCPCKYVRNSDFLRVSAWNSATGVTLEFTGLMMTTWGDMVPIQFTLVPTTARAESSGTMKLTEGWLYHLQCRVSAGTVRRGQCYVKAQIQQGDNDNAIKHTTLIADYVTLDYEPVYPGSPIRSSLEGPGFLRYITGTNPAAGSECSDTVPTNARWRILGWRAQLVTDGTVANRQVHLTLSDGTTQFLDGVFTTTQAASLTRQYNAFPGSINTAGVDTDRYVQLATDSYLFQAGIIATVTTAIVAGDNWGAPQITVEEWIEE